MNLKNRKEGYIGGFEEREGKRMQLYYNLKKHQQEIIK